MNVEDYEEVKGLIVHDEMVYLGQILDEPTDLEPPLGFQEVQQNVSRK